MLSLDNLNPVSLIPGKYLLPAKIVAIALLVIAAIAWWSHHNAVQQKIGYDRAAGEYAQKLAAAQSAARIKTQGLFHAWEHAQNDRIETEKKLAAARAAAADAALRMRDAANNFSISLSGATTETARNAALAAAGLLDQCSAEYQRVAAAADGHRADADQCVAAWPE